MKIALHDDKKQKHPTVRDNRSHAIAWASTVGIFLFTTICFADTTASYYTYESCVKEGTSGFWTASGERFDENDLTCAMRRRDWGTRFKVTNLANGKSVVVRLNDFGPNKKLHDKGRIIDLSKGAFEKIADLRVGVIKVRIEELSYQGTFEAVR